MFSFKNIFKRKYVRPGLLSLLLLFLTWFWFCLPDPLFSDPVSLILKDRNGHLLGAMISADEQWRFPATDSVPEKFARCIIAFEDKRFYHHPGVDLLALGRAAWQNATHGKKISGASTLSMQVMRLSRKNSSRNIFSKIIETWQAVRLEVASTKKDILRLYTAHAPFGGNVVGLEAAAWRYFGKPAHLLSWGESAALAVLPNSPALIHPGRNRGRLLKKRNRLLEKLKEQKIIDSLTCTLAQWEPLPGKPHPLPSLAPHLLGRINHDAPHAERIVESTIDIRLQRQVNTVVNQYARTLSSNGIFNACALVIDTRSGEVLAYTGNSSITRVDIYGSYIDMIQAPRSTGSILKPLLYGFMLEDGYALPEMLIPDIPTRINAFNPKNFNFTYDGAVPANRALARSLNIPAVHLLMQYTPEKFLYRLRKAGISTMRKNGDHYGLALILGGAEASLWEMAGIYTSMGQTLLQYEQHKSIASDNRPHFLFSSHSAPTAEAPVMNPGAIWLTFEAMMRVTRPDVEKYWHLFPSSRKIAWKTGTSFGNRDAWAIGVTPDYVVAVWAGNANGEGRPGLTGIHSAAPLLFDLFSRLPVKKQWFEIPQPDLEEVTVCITSGYPVSGICPASKTVFTAHAPRYPLPCPYHKEIMLDVSGKKQVSGECARVSEMKKTTWFVLPPSMEVYYKQLHPDYRELPPFRSDCYGSGAEQRSIELVYPLTKSVIYLPVNFKGETEATVFEAAHRNKKARIYWHVDENFVGMTEKGIHRISVQAQPGKHKLVLVDETGEKLEAAFEVLSRKK